ncbi:serine/threonine-protein kinase [Streptomyces acidicola]|uniref:serine/threonine-protein kinase n=1 Tax=Streptomyces acidicola TaxID=2596892 RepID=UPI001D14C7B2|nr:serine/threonine-protein kinase [Streptomyces acidicola]
MVDRFRPLTDDDPRSVGGYDFRARLGAGGMGRVYLAFTPGGRALAVKVVRPDYAEDDEFRRRFRKEIDAAQRVQGLYTAPVVDADSEAPLPWLATAYVPGPSLHQAVSEHGPLPLTTVFRLLAGIAEGLTAIHACELIHRDLKPANILLAGDGPRVIDFGIAHAADATTLTSTHVRVGTPAFMAPEQIRGHSASPATDVFALGNLTVFAATGRTAFGEGNPEAMFFRIINEEPELGGCDPELRAVVERCLAKKPGDRPSVGEVMEYAREQLQGETMNLAGAWLPDSLATSLAGYGTAKYTKTGETRKEETTRKEEGNKEEDRKEERTTQKADEDKLPTGSTTPPSGQDNSVLTGLGCLAALIFIVVVAIGPQKVLDWVKSDGEPSESPGYSAPSYSPPTDSTAAPDTGTGTEPIEQDTTDPGCEQASQAISSNTETFDEASAASLSSLASNLDSAADAAEDSEVASVIRALAIESRSMSDSAAGVNSANGRGDATQLKTYQEAFSDAFDQWKKSAETYKSLCE